MLRLWTATAKPMLLLGAAGLLVSTLVASPARETPGEEKLREDLMFRRKIAYTSDRVVLCNSTLYELDKGSGQVLAKFPLDSPVWSDPLIVMDTTYLLSTSAVLTSIKNGKLVWKTTLPLSEKNPADDVTLKASANYLYIGTPHKLFCVDSSTGKILWKQDMTGAMQISGNKLYTADLTHHVAAVDLTSGKVLWKEEGEFSDIGPMLIFGGALYVSHGRDGIFCKLDLSSGKTLWKIKNWSYEIVWEPILSLPGGQIGVEDRNGGFVIFDCNTGKNFKYAPADHPFISTDSHSSIYSKVESLLLNNSLLYAGGNAGGSGIGGYMSAFDPLTKKQKWLTAINEQNIHVMIPAPCAAPVLYSNQLIFPLETGIIYALNSANGKLCWKTETHRQWHGWSKDRRPSIFSFNDKVCVYDSNGTTTVNAANGKKLWSTDIKEPITTTPVQDGQRLYLETAAGTAYAIDFTSSKIAWGFTADGAARKAEAIVVKADDTAQSTPFPSAAWLNTKRGKNWSRQKLMEQFCTQFRSDLDGRRMARKDVLKLLGQPEISYEYTRGNESSQRSEITDKYQLSATKGTFELEYDQQAIVTSYLQSDEPCVFHNTVMPSKELHNVNLNQVREAARVGTVAEFEHLLGPPGKSDVNVAPNFPTPLRLSSYFWSLTSDGRKILWVRTSGMYDQDLAKRRVDVVCIITLSADYQRSVK